MISSGELRLELDKPCEINNRAEALKLVDKFISEQVYHKLLSKKFSRATIVSKNVDVAIYLSDSYPPHLDIIGLKSPCRVSRYTFCPHEVVVQRSLHCIDVEERILGITDPISRPCVVVSGHCLTKQVATSGTEVYVFTPEEVETMVTMSVSWCLS